MYGRKWVLASGIVIFLAGSALAGISQDMIQLIVFRGVQGLGAGTIIANSYGVVADVFPPAQRGKWVGILGAVFALAVVIGPLAGGTVTDHLSWRWIFFLNLPMGIVALAVIVLGMADVRVPRSRRGVDYLGIITLVGAVIPLLLALTWAGKELAWSSPQIVGLLVFSSLMAGLFLLAEKRAKEPIIPGFLFVNPIFTVAVIVTFLTAIVMFSGIILIPIFVQGVIGSSATNAGMILMPVMLSGVVAAIIAGQIISRTGHYQFLAILGVATMAAGAYRFTQLDTRSSSTDAVRYMVVAGAGLGITLPTFMICVQNAFPHHALGVVTASIQFFRNIGGALGTAVLGSFMTIRLADRIHDTVPTEAAGSLPPEVLEKLSDPNSIMNPETMTRIRETVGLEGSASALGTVEQRVRTALAGAMHDVFLLGLGITLAALAVTLFLKEIPLRKTFMETSPELDPGSTD